MANEKVWTPEQKEAAAKVIDAKLYPGQSGPLVEGSVLSRLRSALGEDQLFIDLQCELTEAVELLDLMYHDMGHLMITPEWQRKRREFLKRNTGGSDGK